MAVLTEERRGVILAILADTAYGDGPTDKAALKNDLKKFKITEEEVNSIPVIDFEAARDLLLEILRDK